MTLGFYIQSRRPYHSNMDHEDEVWVGGYGRSLEVGGVDKRGELCIRIHRFTHNTGWPYTDMARSNEHISPQLCSYHDSTGALAEMMPAWLAIAERAEAKALHSVDDVATVLEDYGLRNLTEPKVAA